MVTTVTTAVTTLTTANIVITVTITVVDGFAAYPNGPGRQIAITFTMVLRLLGTVRLSPVDYISCSAQELNPRPQTFKQPSNWFTRKAALNLGTITSAATRNQTQVSRFPV